MRTSEWRRFSGLAQQGIFLLAAHAAKDRGLLAHRQGAGAKKTLMDHRSQYRWAEVKVRFIPKTATKAPPPRLTVSRKRLAGISGAVAPHPRPLFYFIISEWIWKLKNQ